jgi:proteasome lid subunit RPN8/RPN11
MQMHPNEGVALILGRAVAGHRCGLELFAVANLAALPQTQFVMDPQGWLAADSYAQHHGYDIIGICHTHPRGGARPSEHDRASGFALGRTLDYLIVATASTPPQMTAWRWDGDSYIEEALTWI